MVYYCVGLAALTSDYKIDSKLSLLGPIRPETNLVTNVTIRGVLVGRGYCCNVLCMDSIMMQLSTDYVYEH